MTSKHYPSKISASKFVVAVLFMIGLSSALKAQVTVSGALVGNGTTPTLAAAFSAINGGAQTGATISISVTGTTAEPATGAVLNAGAWATLSIQPVGAATIAGAATAGLPLVDLAGADNVTIDGLNTGGNSLTISNTTASGTANTSTIRFINGATNNIITNCSVLGSNSATIATTGGNIYFATDATTSNGNDNNTISNCNLGPAGANLPSRCIFSSGTTTAISNYNSGIILLNNNIFDFFSATLPSAGVYLAAGTTDWTIQNNRIYQTASRTQTTGGIHAGIQIASANVNNCLISGNTIGYASAAPSGTYTFIGVSSASRFYPIYLATHGTTTASSIQGNTIAALNISGLLSGTSTSAPFAGIMIASGLANIGTVTGNTIGSNAVSGSITYSSTGTTTNDLYGIYFFPSQSCAMSNNILGGLSLTNTATGAMNFYGIRANTAVGFINTIQNNTLGSAAAPISLTGTSTSNFAWGIYSQLGQPVVTGNVVSNMTTNSANAGATATTNSLVGINIAATSTTNVNDNVSQNQVYALSNTNTTVANWVSGIIYSGSATASTTRFVSRNFVHSISSSSPASIVNGINIYVGNGVTYQNNMVRLGIDAGGTSITVGCTFNGILEATSTTLASSFYFNSVYIGGSAVVSNLNTFAFNSGVTTAVRNYRNNVFYNARSNASGTGKNYAIQVGGTAPNPAGLTINYNVYFTDGTGGVFGRFNALDVPNLGAWKAAVGQDLNSFSSDPKFKVPGGTSSTVDLHIQDAPVLSPCERNGVNIATITDDFDGQLRSSNTPEDIGADAFLGAVPTLEASIAWVAPVNPLGGAGLQTVTVNITNNQATTITDLVLAYTDGITTQSESFPVNIVQSASQQLSFTTQYNLASFARLRAYITSVNTLMDGNQANDTTTTQNVCVPLSGVYTLNSASPTGGSNFNSFTDAVSFLTSCGVGGPVTINVNAFSGPYNEQINIPAITGASAFNTITFNGNGRTMNFNSANTNERAVIKLNGADYITINNLVLNCATGTYGFGVQLLNDADFNTISNCVINTDLASTSTTNFAGIVINSTATAIVTAGASLCDNNIISGNTVNGGYANIAIVGNGATSVVNNNQVINNILKDCYTYGVYLNGGNNTLIEGNDIMRPVRTTVTTFNGVFLTGVSTNSLISKNRIHNPFGASAASTGAAFNIYLNSASGTAGNENIVSNNIIYDIIGGTGNHNGFLNNASSFVKYFNNTVYLNDVGATCSACGARGIYFQGTTQTGVTFRNNNIYISKGGDGPKQCIFFEATSLTGYTLSNNNYFITSSGGALNEIARTGGSSTVNTQGTGYTAIGAWQTGSSQEAGSKSTDPYFVSPATGNLTPNSYALDNSGIPVGVTTDITNAIRSATTPDIGAYEFTVPPAIDLGAIALVTPAINTVCYSDVQTVVVRIKNYGIAVDFSTDPVTVTCNITGPSAATLTGTVSSGTLAVDGTFDVTLSGTFDMSANGTYTFNASTSTANDANAGNNAMAAATRTRAALVAGSIASDKTELCFSGSVTLTLTGNANGNYQWQSSTTSASGPWANIGTESPTYVSGTITQTTYYRVLVTCLTVSTPTNVITINVNKPLITGTTPGSHCGLGTVTIAATASPGATIKWYADASGGSALATGPSFTTPVITSTTTYYAAASQGGGGLFTLGRTDRTDLTANTNNNSGIVFSAPTGGVLQSVSVYPSGTGAGTLKIVLKNGNSATATRYDSVTVNLTGVTIGSATKTVIPLNFVIPPGIDYYLSAETFSGGLTGLGRELSGSTFPYTAAGTDISLTGSWLTTSAPTLTTYYYFYDWKVTQGCEGSRTPVLATITPAPPITLTSSEPGLCAGGSASLNVSSTNDPNYTYTWTSNPAGFSQTGNGPFVVSPTATTTYSVNATDNSAGANAGCVNVANVTIPVVSTLVAGAVTVSQNTFCVSGTPTLTLTGSQGFIQWQSSTTSSSGPWTNVGTGNTTFIPSSPVTQTTYYRATVSCQASSLTTNVETVTVNNPAITGTTPGSRCGVGTVNLQAATDAGNTIKWYANATGGVPLSTGSSFTTPVISSNTTYYAAAASGTGGGPLPEMMYYKFDVPGTVVANEASTPVGNNPAAVTGLTIGGTGQFGTGLQGNAGATATNRVDPGWTGTHTGSWTISFWMNVPDPPTTRYMFGNTSGNGTFRCFIGGAANTIRLTGGVPTITLDMPNWVFGTSVVTYVYDQALGTVSGYINGVFQVSVSVGSSYPLVGTNFVVGSQATSIEGTMDEFRMYSRALTASEIASTFSVPLGGCEGSRVPVLATVTPPPAVNATTSNSLLCNGGSASLNATSANGGYTYVWTPGNLTGAAQMVTPAATTTYSVTATDNSGGPNDGCVNVQSVPVAVQPASVTIKALPAEICNSGTSVLSLEPATGYAAGSIQWQSSSDNINFVNIAGANAATYTTPTLTNTIVYYKALVKDGNNAICFQPSVTISASTPAVTGSTPATRCGTGPITLQATGSGAGTMKWYDASTGGLVVGQGNSFTTTLSASKTFYAEQSFGTTGGTPLVISEIDIGTNDQLEIMNVSGAPLDVTGWHVAVSNSYTAITSVNANVQTLSGIMADGEIKSWTDLSSGPNYWGSNILWNPGAYPSFTGWAVILDQNNVIVDFVALNWPSANIQGASFTVGASTITVGNKWIGDGINQTTVAGTQSISRQGNSDNNVASDFSIINLSINTLNPGMTSPFTGFGCASPRTAVLATVTPAPAVTASASEVLVCPGGATTLSASSPNPGYSYTWNPGNLPGASVGVNTQFETIYTVSAHDGTGGSFAGCDNTATVTVSTKPKIYATATANPNFICAGDNVALSSSANTTSQYAFSATTPSAFPVPGSGYQVLDKTVSVNSGDLDDGTWKIDLPFAISFFGQQYDELFVGTNGYVSFGAGYDVNTPPVLPVATTPNNAIYLAEYDWDYRTSGQIKYFAAGTAPHRFFVLDYSDVPPFSGTGDLNGQIVIDETTGKITLNLFTAGGNTVKTVGIENAAGTVSYGPSLRNGVAFTVSSPESYEFDPAAIGGNFTYSWSPTTYLDDPSIASPLAMSVFSSVTYTVTITSVATGCSNIDTTKIITGAPLAANVNVSDNIICSGESVSLEVTGSGGCAPYSYAWNDGITTTLQPFIIANPTTTTVYEYTVTDNTGAEFTGSVTITVNPTPVITVNPGLICGTGTATLTASSSLPGTTYTWSPSTNLNTTTGNTVISSTTTTRIYTVTGTANNCPGKATSTVTFSVPVTVSATATPDVVCNNGSSQLNAVGIVAQGPEGFYSVAPVSGQTYSTLSGPAITVINTVAGLSTSMSNSQDDGAVLINLPFTFNFLGNSFTQMTMCTNGWVGAGNLLAVTAVNGRAAGNLFTSTEPNNIIAAWFKDMGANFPTGTGSMRHGLIGTDVYAFQWDNAVGSGFSDGSANTISFQINIYGPASGSPARVELIYGPQVNTLATAAAIGLEDNTGGTNHYLNALTANGTATTTSTAWPGNGNGYRFDLIPAILNYSWSPSTFLSSSTIANPVASNMTASTTYVVTATNAAGCTATASAAVTVGQPLSATAASTTNNFCEGLSTTLNPTVNGGGQPYSYSWSDGTSVVGTTASVTLAPPSGSTTYILTVNDACANSTTASVTVTVKPAPTLAVTKSGDICGSGSVTLTATGNGATYVWSPTTNLSPTNGSGAVVVASPTGTRTYTVTSTGSNACTKALPIMVTVYPVAQVTATATPANICANASSQLSASAKYLQGALLITEVTQFQGATAGATTPRPSYWGTSDDDFAEISNVSTTPVDASGLIFELYSGTTLNRSFTIPSGVTIQPQGVLVLHFGTGTDSPANNFFHTGGTANPLSSGTVYGYVLKSGTTVLDAVATNGGTTTYAWPAVSGVTSADWSGNTPSNSSQAGSIRTGVSDSNTGADWVTSSAATPQTLGVYNGGYQTPPAGNFSFSWSPSTYLNNALISNPLASNVASSINYVVTVTDATSPCIATKTVALTAGAPLVVTATKDIATICAGKPDTVRAVVSGGGEPYTYSWSAGSTSLGTTQKLAVNPLVTTAYTVTVSDVCGNVTTASVTINVNPLPNVAISPVSGSICNGVPANIPLTASGANTYLWSPTAGLSSSTSATPTAAPASTTIYTVTGTNTSTTCTNTATTTIYRVDLTAAATATPATICSGTNSQLQANVTFAQSPASSYALSLLAGQTYAPLSGAGITIINTTAQLSAGLTNNSDDGGVVVALPFTFNFNGTNYTQMTFCTNGWVGGGDQMGITSAQSRASANFFTTTVPNSVIAAWFKDMGANFPTGSGSMRHGLIGTDLYAFQWDNAVGSGFSDGSTNTISFQVNIYGPASGSPGQVDIIYGPQANTLATAAAIGIEDAIGGTNHYLNAITGNGTVTTTSSAWPGNGDGYRFSPVPKILNYSWSPVTFLSNATLVNPVATAVTATTNYVVTATEPASGCTRTASATVSLFTATTATISGTTEICPGGSATLNFAFTGNAPYTYSYSDGSTTFGPFTSAGASATQTVTPGTTKTYTIVSVSDANCNGTVSGSAVVTIDTHAPVITCPPPVTVQTNPGFPFATGVVLGSPVITDLCTYTVANNAPSTYLIGNTTVTWTATDASGNTSTCAQIVTVSDNQAPIITCPATVTVNADAGQCLATNVILGTLTATDNDGVASITNTGQASYPVGNSTVIWTATDITGNTSTCSQTVTVIDNQPPVIACPAPVTVVANAGVCYATGVILGTPVSSDNCAVASTMNNAPAQIPGGVNSIIWTVTDVNGNSSTCSQSVTVLDTQKPVLNGCPSNFASCAPISWTPPTATDNCTPAGSITISSNYSPGSFFPSGATTVIYTATDASGNSATCSFVVTKQDSSLLTGITLSSNKPFNNICTGDNITLSLNGVTATSLGFNAHWKWYSGSCGGTAVPGSTDQLSITVSPNANTSYFVRAEGTCNNTACLSLPVIVSTAPPSGNPGLAYAPTVDYPGATDSVVLNAVPGATFYRWTTNGNSILLFDGQPAPYETSSPKVMVTFVSPSTQGQGVGNYHLQFIAGNACGRTNQNNVQIRATVAPPSSVSGSLVACVGQTLTYSVPAITGAKSYQWNFTSGGGTITGNGTQTVNVTFTSLPATLCVHGVTAFNSAGPDTCITISTVTAVPGAITGNVIPCLGSSEVYSIAPVSGAVSYTWTTTVPGATIIPNGTSATVNYPTGAFTGIISVTAYSGCANSAPSTLSIVSGTVPPLGNITGITEGVCSATSVNYQVPSIGATNYAWNTPPGATITTGQGTNSILVDFSNTYAGGNITVVATNTCGTVPGTLFVTGAPVQPVFVESTNSACIDDVFNYIASSPGATTYNWSVTGGNIITTGNDDEILVEWTSNGGSVSVTAANSCGNSTPAVLTVTSSCRVSGSNSMVEALQATVYPNPSQGRITLQFNSAEHAGYLMKITDVTGRELMKEQLHAMEGLNQHEINLGTAAKGVYMLTLESPAGDKVVIRIVVE